MKKIHFISGLPRSGSTLLCNILDQNPAFGVTGTSGVLGIVTQIRNTWNQSSELLASAEDAQRISTMRGALQGYFETYTEDILFDKSRGWTGYVEMAEMLTDSDVKIIACVRDMTDILASFEAVFRKNAGTGIFPQERQFPVDWITPEGRSSVMVRGDQPVGSAYNRLKDALHRGHGDKIHLVEFQELTTEPAKTLRGIYKFLGYKYYRHNFKNVEQTIFENDLFHGMGKDLHKIRKEVKPRISNARKILGDQLYKQFSNQEFWR